MLRLWVALMRFPWGSVLLFLSDLAVIVYAVVAILLWRETKKSADAALKNAASAEANADSARKTLDAMVEANRINREAIRCVQRAYVTFPIVGIDSERITDCGSGKITGWRFYMPVENSGNTPARELRIHTNWHWHPGEIPEEFGFQDYGPDEQIGFPLPGGAKIFSACMEIGRDIIERLAAGQINLYFYGWAAYRDTFEKTEIHRTIFCYEVRLLQVDEKVRMELKFHGNHNDYD